MWRVIVRVPVAALLLVILFSTFRIDWVPWWVPSLLVAFAAFSAWRPAAALIVCAGVAPVAGWVGAHWNYSAAWPEALVLSFAMGWTIRDMRPQDTPVPPLLRMAASCFAAVVIAAALVESAVLEVRLGTAGFSRVLWNYIGVDYFLTGPAFRALQAAALLLEGLFLLIASVRAGISDPRWAFRATRALVAGTAVAAAINVVRLAQAAARAGGFWPTLAEYLSTLRINVHYGDANAAGSQFAMILFVAAGLTLGAGRRRAVWCLAAIPLALGLWISGSRAALLCAVAGAAVVFIAPRGGRARHTVLALAVAGALVSAAFLGVAYLPARGAQKAVDAAVASRTGLIMTGLRMLHERPLFGIGLGEFYERSGEFSSPELLQLFPAARHENAHNNFLQVLAELGVIGFAAFVAVIGAALARAAVWLHERPRDALRLACVGGLVTFLFTCLGGHPLLTREPAYAFWLLLGIAAGGATTLPASPGSSRWSARGALPLIAVLLVLITIPFRASVQMHDENFEHVGIGLSKWQMADDGVRYRWAEDGGATVFVPGRGKGFLLRVRSSDVPARVELHLDGRLANAVNVDAAQWTEVRVLLPSDPNAPRFSRLDLRSVPATKLMIGKVEPY